MLKFLLNNKFVSVFIISTLLFQIGVGLTQAAVYGKLSDSNSDAFWYGLTFFLGIFPGYISSKISQKLSKTYQLWHIITLSFIGSAIFLLVPLFVFSQYNIHFLILAEAASSFSAGMCMPIFQLIFKRSIQNSELKNFAKVDSLVFFTSVILGTGIGAVLYNGKIYYMYIVVNIILYLISSIIIFFLRSKNFEKNIYDTNIQIRSSRILSLSSEKRTAFLLMPILCVVTSPLMAILPFIGQRIGSKYDLLGLIISPALFLLFAKSIGQFIGPFLIRDNWFEPIYKNKLILISILIGFQLLYITSYYFNNVILSIFLIISAHILSNLISTTGFYAFQKNFSEKEILDFSGLQYRWIIIVMSTCSLISGIALDKFGIYLLAIIPMIIVIFFTVFMRKPLRSAKMSVENRAELNE